MKYNNFLHSAALITFLLIFLLILSSPAKAKLYDLKIIDIDFKEGPRYKSLSYEKNRYEVFTVHHYSTSSINFRQVPYELFSVTITTYDSMPSGYAVTDALSQSAYGYLTAQGCSSDKSRFLKLKGKDALEIEYNEKGLRTRNIATFFIHHNSVITIEYRCSGGAIKDYRPYRDFLKTIILK